MRRREYVCIFLEKRPEPDFINKATWQRHEYPRFTQSQKHKEKLNRPKFLTKQAAAKHGTQAGERRRPNPANYSTRLIRHDSSRRSERLKPEFWR